MSTKTRMIRNTSKILSEFKKDPKKVFFDTFENMIENAYVYKVNKKEIIEYLDKKLNQLENELEKEA